MLASACAATGLLGAILAVVLPGAVLAALAFRGTSTRVLRVGLIAPLGALDPAQVGGGVLAMAQPLVFEGLIRFDEKKRPEPALAEALTWSDDRRTLDITLRTARFHDGRPVRATDVAAALRTVPKACEALFRPTLDAMRIEVLGELRCGYDSPPRRRC